MTRIWGFYFWGSRMVKCLNCGYVQQPEDDSANTLKTECPKCHSIYENDDRPLLKKEIAKAEEWLAGKDKGGNSTVNSIATGESDNIEMVSEENNDIEKAKQCYIKGSQEFDSGNYKQAIKYYSEAIKLNPHHYMAYVNRGISYEKIDGWIEAEKDLKIAENLESTIPNESLTPHTVTFNRNSKRTLIIIGAIAVILLVIGIINGFMEQQDKTKVQEESQAFQAKQQRDALITAEQARIQAAQIKQEAESESLLQDCESSCISGIYDVDDRCVSKCKQEAWMRNIEIGKLREMQKQR
jgi:tetratricopeptide (TPR) repeat protein